jgi:hypothetical protein
LVKAFVSDRWLMKGTTRTSPSSKRWASVYKLAEYKGVNKDVSRGYDSRRVFTAAFLAMQTSVIHKQSGFRLLTGNSSENMCRNKLFNEYVCVRQILQRKQLEHGKTAGATYGGWLPRIIFIVISLPFDEIPEE